MSWQDEKKEEMESQRRLMMERVKQETLTELGNFAQRKPKKEIVYPLYSNLGQQLINLDI